MIINVKKRMKQEEKIKIDVVRAKIKTHRYIHTYINNKTWPDMLNCEKFLSKKIYVFRRSKKQRKK